MKKTLLAAVVCLLYVWPSHSGLLSIPKVSADDSVLVSENLSSGEKRIEISLDNQTLVYSEGERTIKEIKISSGLKGTPTPVGEFEVLEKIPVVNYVGPGYNLPNTKWNLMFKRNPTGNYYIHGAYWHNKFGQPLSHGCINVSYAEMEALYDWAEPGTKITITDTAERHPRGSVVLSEGTIYFLGQEVRYAFPSEEIFFSWGAKFEDVLVANSADLAMPLGPAVQLKR
jgi:hypothetical protein